MRSEPPLSRFAPKRGKGKVRASSAKHTVSIGFSLHRKLAPLRTGRRKECIDGLLRTYLDNVRGQDIEETVQSEVRGRVVSLVVEEASETGDDGRRRQRRRAQLFRPRLPPARIGGRGQRRREPLHGQDRHDGARAAMDEARRRLGLLLVHRTYVGQKGQLGVWNKRNGF